MVFIHPPENAPPPPRSSSPYDKQKIIKAHEYVKIGREQELFESTVIGKVKERDIAQ